MSQLSRRITRTFLTATLFATLALVPSIAQTTSQLGPVKSIDGGTITITGKDGSAVNVTLIPEGKVVVLAPGVTKLEQGTPGTVSDIEVGDRVLATGKPGDSAGVLNAQRIVLMKATALAEKRKADDALWARPAAGIVKSNTGGVLVLASGGKTVTIQTTPATIIRRYADDSVEFQKATVTDLASIRVGDQLQARGDRTPDGATVTAAEIVDGSFSNLAGIIKSIDPTLGTVTFQDLATRKPVTVKLTANSQIKKIDPGASAMLLGAGGPGGPGGGPGGPPSGGGGYSGGGGGGYPGGGSRPGGAPAGGGTRVSSTARRSADLTRMMSRLPPKTLADLKPGDAVMVVATQPSGSGPYTAITMLGGVEQILAAKPENGEAIQLQPFSMGEGDMGGGMGMGGPGGGGI